MPKEVQEDNPNTQDNNDDLYERFSFKTDKGQEPLRIDKFLMNRIEGATRNKLQQSINAGMVLVNGKDVRPNYKVKALDEIIVYSDMSPEEMEIIPEKIPLNIVYEDNSLMLINKPAGMVVHPAYGNYSGTLVNAVSYHLYPHLEGKKIGSETVRPGMVHRIDKNTSGLIDNHCFITHYWKISTSCHTTSHNGSNLYNAHRTHHGIVAENSSANCKTTKELLSHTWDVICDCENYLKLIPKVNMARKRSRIIEFWSALDM